MRSGRRKSARGRSARAVNANELLEAALADMKKAAPCAICAHHGTPECYFRQRGMFCRELPNGGKFTWRGLTQEGKENENVQ